MHLIHVHANGLPTLKKGGPFPYPDETIFADDVHEFSVKDGATFEGDKKFVTTIDLTSLLNSNDNCLKNPAAYLRK
jgi:hypothetical protein